MSAAPLTSDTTVMTAEPSRLAVLMTPRVLCSVQNILPVFTSSTSGSSSPSMSGTVRMASRPSKGVSAGTVPSVARALPTAMPAIERTEISGAMIRLIRVLPLPIPSTRAKSTLRSRERSRSCYRITLRPSDRFCQSIGVRLPRRHFSPTSAQPSIHLYGARAPISPTTGSLSGTGRSQTVS